ncbi:MAG: toprim domain-containing protein [Candidatus Bathyarchaeia archaeon]
MKSHDNPPLRRKYVRIGKILERIASAGGDSVIIVEGRRDEESLRRLGITGNIYRLKSSRIGFREFPAILGPYREAIILTDFDREGEELAIRIQRELAPLRVRANYSLWNQLRGLVSSDIKSVEDLADYLKKMELELRS